MRYGCLLIVLLLTLMAQASAQEPGISNPKIELSVGSELVHFATAPSANMAGLNLSGQYKWTNWFGLAGEFNAAYGTEASVHSILLGPEVFIPRHFSPFAHILIGGTHLSQRQNGGTAYTTEIGGGLDLNIGPRVSWKLAQFDYIPTYLHQGRQDSFRFGTGITFRFSSIKELVPWPIRGLISDDSNPTPRDQVPVYSKTESLTSVTSDNCGKT